MASAPNGSREPSIIDTSPYHRGDAPDTTARDILRQAWVAALVADKGPAEARSVLSRHPSLAADAGARRQLFSLLDRPPRPVELADRVYGTRLAPAVYRVALKTIDGERAAGRVFLEDLAEALLLPPTLIRELQRCRTASASLAA